MWTRDFRPPVAALPRWVGPDVGYERRAGKPGRPAGYAVQAVDHRRWTPGALYSRIAGLIAGRYRAECRLSAPLRSFDVHGVLGKRESMGFVPRPAGLARQDPSPARGTVPPSPQHDLHLLPVVEAGHRSCRDAGQLQRRPRPVRERGQRSAHDEFTARRTSRRRGMRCSDHCVGSRGGRSRFIDELGRNGPGIGHD